jgi:hypothetical protein
VISRHFHFESYELENYRQLHMDQSLRWLDTEFMFQLALDQIMREVATLISRTHGEPNRVEEIDHVQLLLLYINGDIPLLDSLLEICGEHYLLHRQLQDLKAFPTLHTDCQGTDCQGSN